MTTSLAQVPDGQMSAFKTQLARAGLTAEDVRNVNREPDLAARMVEAVRSRDLFVSPNRQLEQVRRWNDEYFLDLPDAAFEQLGPAPQPPAEYSLVTPLLAVYLEGNARWTGPQRTFRVFWRIASNQRKGTFSKGEIHSVWEDERIKKLRLANGTDYRPGLKWLMVDLGAAYDPEGQQRLLHVEVVVAAAQFMVWLDQIDKTVPSVTMGGFANQGWGLPQIWQNTPTDSVWLYHSGKLVPSWFPKKCGRAVPICL